MAEALQRLRGALLLPGSCCHPRGAASGHAEPPGCKMTLASTTPATTSVAQAFFCLLLCIPWGSSCPPSCQCTERAGAKAVLCSSQHLEEIPKDIPRDAVLLKLDANSTTSIPGNASRHLSHLEEADLSGNAIERIDRAAFRGVAAGLRSLGLSGIRSIPKEALLALRAELRPANSPWHCQCALGGAAGPRLRAGHHLPLLQVLDAGANLGSARHRSTDVAVLVTVFGWLAVVTGSIACYARHNRERSRRHGLRARPGAQPRADTSSTAL